MNLICDQVSIFSQNNDIGKYNRKWFVELGLEWMILPLFDCPQGLCFKVSYLCLYDTFYIFVVLNSHLSPNPLYCAQVLLFMVHYNDFIYLSLTYKRQQSFCPCFLSLSIPLSILYTISLHFHNFLSMTSQSF